MTARAAGGTCLALLLAAASARAGPWLQDATSSSGLSFRHHAGRTGSWHLPETMGSGGALLDLDSDGDLDVLLLDQGSPPGTKATAAPTHALFRNDSQKGVLRFAPLPAPGLAGVTAMGACTGDVDGDGDDDAYVTGLPAGRLLLNAGGRLAEAPRNGSIDDAGWGTSCAFLDADRAGGLDLFVAHYVKWSPAAERPCGGEREGFRTYCAPDQYLAAQDRLFAGDGKGRFRDVTAEAGLSGERGKGLGVVATDIDGDGRTDLYVANDQTPSALWLAREAGGFRDVALVAGVALSEEGRAQAGMGVDAGDIDGDLDVDLTKTNFAMETTNLYVQVSRRDGLPRFRDGIRAAGLAQVTLRPLGFGTILEDLDADGDLDAFVANGHIMPNVAVLQPELQSEQEDQLLQNLGSATPGAVPRFRDARDAWLPAAAATGLGRGVLAGDLDSDGDIDLIVTRNDGPARVLRNDANPRRWAGARLRSASSPGAPGAQVVLRGAGPARLALRRTGGSYLCASDERVLFGLTSAPASCEPRAEVRWPSGRREDFPLQEGRYVTLTEGTGTPR